MLGTFEYEVNLYGQMDQTVTVENSVLFLEGDSFNYYSMDRNGPNKSYSFYFILVPILIYVSFFYTFISASFCFVFTLFFISQQ